jgi:CRISPR-associated helicase Cas3/CRISPR-associated endonuclease Cas3-HD
MTQYFAHSANKAGSPWEPLKEHSSCVAKRASGYADAFGAKQEALIAGLLHDLGKYSDIFTKRLNGEVSSLDHWSMGALATLHTFRDKGIAAALAIQGHHVGLQEGLGSSIHSQMDLSMLSDPASHPQQLKLTESDWKLLLDRFVKDGFSLPRPPIDSHYDLKALTVASMLDARMLFSALVDADYIETEAHFDGKSDGTKLYRPEGPLLNAEQALEIVTKHLAELEHTAKSSEDVKKMRKQLFDACLLSAAKRKGIFTLTAPTGAGKTLAMLAFALKHAVVHPKIRRIVMVVPFLNIIDQTAKVYRELLKPHFGSHYILEHHSLADGMSRAQAAGNDRDNEEEARRTASLLAENWDAPVVITTSVQFFESLFANRPAKCRKLHRLANSIILFDEVQTLPPRIAVPSLAALSRLAERYDSTVVFSTATQPAFDHLHGKVKLFAGMGWQPRTIMEEPLKLFAQARRVGIDWQINESRSWESVADELALDQNARALCIVNLKRHAKKLVKLLKDKSKENGLFHLSTNMCPAHRGRVLDQVRERLASTSSKPCRLISTQCVEAGVDLDFPVAWRAFGPLDAIAQAAGRCNREGQLGTKGGRMIVFLPEKEDSREHLYPPGGYKEAAATTLTLLKSKEIESTEKGVPLEEAFDIYNPDLFNQYYRLLYDLTGTAEFDTQHNELADAVRRRSFVDVATAPYRYRIIEQGSINVLVPYANEMVLFESLKKQLYDAGRLTRNWIYDARPLTVSMYRPRKDHDVWTYLEAAPLGRGEKADDWFIYLNKKDYDPLLGLNPLNEVDAWTI